MAERKSKEELNKIKKEYNVSELYSWSKYNLWKTDTYSWFLKYVLRKKEDRKDSIYGASGSIVHDLMEEFYLGNIKYQDLKNEYEDKIFELEFSGYKFDRTNEEKNKKISDKYNYCNKHFLENFKPIKGNKIELEKFLLIKVSKFLFQGYSDFEHQENIDGRNKIVITDFKTSTIYKGKKIEKERGQLLLYALGKIQEGWKIEDVIIRWLFTKYVSVRVPIKDSFRYREISRHEIGKSLKASVLSQLKKIKKYTEKECEDIVNSIIKSDSIDDIDNEIKIYIEDIDRKKDNTIKKTYISKTLKTLKNINKYSEMEIDMLVDEMIETNSINCMPQEIKDIFVIRDCYVEIPFNKNDIKQLQIDIVKSIVEMTKKQIQYKENNDDSIFFSEINKENEYFHAVLSGYSPKIHKPYKEYLDNLNMFKEHSDIEEDLNDILNELGLDL